MKTTIIAIMTVGIVAILLLFVGKFAGVKVDVKDYQKTPVTIAVNDTLIFIGDDAFISTSTGDTLIFIGDDTFVDSSSAQSQPFVSRSWHEWFVLIVLIAITFIVLFYVVISLF
jgi:hypothetical protein